MAEYEMPKVEHDTVTNTYFVTKRHLHTGKTEIVMKAIPTEDEANQLAFLEWYLP
jgi:hypothetical protein